MRMKRSLRPVVTRERTDCLARKRSLRRLRKPDRARQELHQRVLRQNKCESTGSRTPISGVGVLGALRDERRVGRLSVKKWAMMKGYSPSVLIIAS